MWVFLIHNKPKGYMVLVQGNKVLKLVKSLYRLKQVSIQWHQTFLTMRWCQMSLDLMRLVCDVKYITWCYVVMGYARVSVVDVIQEKKISNTSNELVLSQSHEKCDNSLVRTSYAKSICIFWEDNKSKQTCIVGYLCLLFV